MTKLTDEPNNMCDECGAICQNCTTHKPTRTATCVTCDNIFTVTINDSGIVLVNHRCR